MSNNIGLLQKDVWYFASTKGCRNLLVEDFDKNVGIVRLENMGYANNKDKLCDEYLDV